MRRALLFVLLFSILLNAASVEKQIHTLSDELMRSISIDKDQQLAVLPFMKKEGESDLGLAIAEILIANIMQNNDITLVDRQNLKSIIDEQTLALSGMIDENKMIEVGKMASADFILTGKIIPSMGNYLVSAQITNAETGEIVAAGTVTLPKGEADTVVKKLFEEKNYPLFAAFRSTLIPGWGQAACDEKKHAIIAASLCGAGLTTSIITGIMQKNQYDEHKEYHALIGTPAYLVEKEKIANELGLNPNDMKIDTIFNERLAEKHDAYEDKRSVFITSTAITGSLWALNIVDAIICGKKAERKFKLYFAGNPVTEEYTAQLTYKF